MSNEMEESQEIEEVPERVHDEVRSSRLINILKAPLGKIRNPFHGKIGTARAALAASLTNAVVVALLYYQNYYQQKATDRLWSAQQIAVIYDEDCSFKPDGTQLPCQFKASNRSRENAVRAYVEVEGHKGAARLTGANLAGMSFAGTDFSYVDLSGSVFTYAILTDAILTGATLIGANLQNATLIKANMRDAVMTGAYLEGANFQKADLRNARLEKVVLGSCDSPVIDYGSTESYTAADLTGADLRGAVLTGASLCEVDISGADLTDVVGLNKTYLKRAWGNGKTKLPKGMKRPERWLKTRDAKEQKNRAVKHPVPKEGRPPQ